MCRISFTTYCWGVRMRALTPALPRKGREQSIPSLREGSIRTAEGGADRGRERALAKHEVSDEIVSESHGCSTPCCEVAAATAFSKLDFK